MLSRFKGDKMGQQMKRLEQLQSQLPPELRAQLKANLPRDKK